MRFFILLLISLAPFSSEAQSNFPGGYIDLQIEKLNDQLPEVKFGLREPVIIDLDDHWRILIGLDLSLLPGQYVMYYKHTNDDTSGKHKTLEVIQKVYPFNDLEESAPDEMVDYYPQIALSSIDFANTQQPTLPLSKPLIGDWQQQFGFQWFVEGGDEVITNNAISIKARQFSPVLAPQNAIVSNIIMDQRELATLVLDHGRGLYSVLHGLTDLTVDIGNGVVAGAVLGRLPALTNIDHSRLVWQTLLNGVFVDPNLLSKRDLASEHAK